MNAIERANEPNRQSVSASEKGTDINMTENRRVRMTKKMMKEAMLELLDDKPLEKISVTDICERADVNRSTFYAYYQDISQLMYDIEEEVLNQLPRSPYDNDASKADNQILEDLKDLFDYVRENERLFRILFVQHDNSSFNKRLVSVVMEKYRTSPTGVDESVFKYDYIFVVNGVIGMLKEWIIDGFPFDSIQFAKMVLKKAQW